MPILIVRLGTRTSSCQGGTANSLKVGRVNVPSLVNRIKKEKERKRKRRERKKGGNDKRGNERGIARRFVFR